MTMTMSDSISKYSGLQIQSLLPCEPFSCCQIPFSRVANNNTLHIPYNSIYCTTVYRHMAMMKFNIKKQDNHRSSFLENKSKNYAVSWKCAFLSNFNWIIIITIELLCFAYRTLQLYKSLSVQEINREYFTYIYQACKWSTFTVLTEVQYYDKNICLRCRHIRLNPSWGNKPKIAEQAHNVDLQFFG